MSEKTGGFLVISLDFELHWGMFDKVSVEKYGDRYIGVHKVLPEILASFAEHNIHATWATVGMLMADGKEELFSLLPPEELRPKYQNPKISSYYHIATAPIGKNEKEDPHHFAPSLVRDILATPGQELASHTFSHFYCIDGKENREIIFDADVERVKEMFATFDQKPTSIVFPRNQTTRAALTACKAHGITTYRGTESHAMYRPRGDGEQTFPVRAMRILDAYINLSGNNTTPLSKTKEDGMINIPASRFLRPYSRRLRVLESMRMRRIKNSMTHAAKHNQIFHLWWHPHNFGAYQKQNMQNLHNLLSHFNVLRETYGMESANMRELTERIETPTP